MSTTKIIAVIAASAMVGLFSGSAFAESIPQQEIDQYGNSAAPDVDPGASKGPDASIVNQEQNQLGNDPAKDLDKNRPGRGGETLPQMEEKGIPGGDR